MKKGVNRFLLLCLTFIFLIGVVNAWSVNIVNPVNGSYFGSKPSQFSWTYSGIDFSNLSSNLEYNVNGNVNYGLTANSNQAIGSSQVIQGWNTILLSVTNITGQTENATLDFWVDSISPLLAVLNPLGNIGYTNTNTLNLIVQLTETNKGGYHPSGNSDSSNKYIWRQFSYPSGGGSFNSYLLDSSNISDASLPLSLGDQEEGNYTFIIKSRDKYPNGSTIREITEEGIIIRDTLPPITLINSPSAGLYYSGIINIISSANDDDSVTTDVSGVNNITINITNGLFYSQKFSSDSSPLNYNWDSTTENGNYIIEATSYDRAGNSDLETITIIVDNIAPTGTISVDTNPIYDGDLIQVVTITYDETMNNVINPTITFTGNIGAITSQEDGFWDITNMIWTETFVIADVNEETIVNVESSNGKDLAGNLEGPPISTTFDIDTKNPTGTISVDTNPIYDGDLIQVVAITYDETMNNAINPTITFAGNTGAITSQGDGSWDGTNTIWTETFNVADVNEETLVSVESSNGKDLAGNVEGISVSDTFNIDTLAPSGYSVLFDQNYVNIINQNSISFTFAGAEIGATYIHSIDDTNGVTLPITGTGIILTATDQISGIDVSTLDDDTLTLTIYLTDPAGNQGADTTDTITKDTLAPTFTIIDGTDAGPVQTDTINVDVNDINLNLLSLEYGFSADAICDATDTYGNSFTDATNFDIAGDYASYLCVKSDDDAGNTGYGLIGQLNTDNTSPILNLVSIVSNNINPVYAKVGEIITISFTANEGLTANPIVSILGQPAIVTNLGGNSYTADYTLIGGETEGIVTFTIDFIDLASNNGIQIITTTDASSVTFDETSPVVDILAPLTTEIIKDSVITFTDDELTNPECSVDDIIWTMCVSGTTTLNDITGFAGLLEGPFNLYLRDIDLAGNIGTDSGGGIIKDTIDPTITLFQAIPSQNISQNNPTTISATDVSDANLDFTGLMFVDYNNLISSDQILFLANMNDAPVSGAYGPINWNANYFKITDGTISEPVSVFVTDFAPTENIVMGYLQEDPTIPTPVEDCMLGFDMVTNELTATSYCAGSRIDGISKFTISSYKFANGTFSPPSEINGSAFTLYTLGNPANPKLESAPAPSGDYNLILQVEDSAENENGEILNISVDNTYPSLTNITLSSSVISPANADLYLDDLTITMNANELVDWGTTRIYNALGNQVKYFNGPSGYVNSNIEVWTGAFANGTFVPDGVYTINTTITDQAGNSVTIVVGSITVDNTIPTLSGISAASITSSSASIIWTTNENANSNVSYGTTILMTSNLGSLNFESSHSISLSSLSASTFYYFNVTSCDAAGNCDSSTQYNFTTSAQGGGDTGNGGGGGSGGGGSSITYYSCSKWNDWSVCNSNEQTRTCLEKITTTSEKGVIASAFKDKETQTCASSVLTPLSNPVTAEGTNAVSPQEPIIKERGFIGRITGGITGVAVGFSKSKGGKISLIVIAVLALAFGLLAWRRKINKKDLSRKIKIIHKSDLAGRK